MRLLGEPSNLSHVDLNRRMFGSEDNAESWNPNLDCALLLVDTDDRASGAMERPLQDGDDRRSFGWPVTHIALLIS